MAKYRVLAGSHIEADPNSPKKERRYRAGEIVDSAIDLEARFNSPGSRKFERVWEEQLARAAGTPAAPAPPVATGPADGRKKA